MLMLLSKDTSRKMSKQGWADVCVHQFQHHRPNDHNEGHILTWHSLVILYSMTTLLY